VHWSEGLFLQPHHFQAAERSATETLQTSERWDHHYGYGVRTLELSEEAIANYQFQVNVCHARMKDGTIVALDPGQELDRLDLKEAFAQESVVKVYLAVPKLRMGATNVRSSGQKTQARYVEVSQSVQDESSGGSDQELRFRMLDLRLLLSTQDMAGYEVLPLAQVQRAAAQQAAPCIDPTYFPPMLAIDAWPPLGRDVIRAIYDIIGQRIEVLSTQVISRGITLDGRVPGDLDRLFKLHELNAAYAVLQVMAFAAGVHPFTAYVELCRLVGRLSIFDAGRRPPEIPRYDHDDLATIFRKIKALIEVLVKDESDEPEQRWFEGDGPGMRVAFESMWLGGDWQWFIGVKYGGITRQKCEELLREGGTLNWKLASSRQVGDVFRLGRKGLHLSPLAQAPPALPVSSDWLYFEVNRDNEFWRDVLDTQTLAMRFSDRTIINRQELQGQRHLVVRDGPTAFWLEFALFAVPHSRRSP
jgi:type VI secretion system protein ImpJ